MGADFNTLLWALTAFRNALGLLLRPLRRLVFAADSLLAINIDSL